MWTSSHIYRCPSIAAFPSSAAILSPTRPQVPLQKTPIPLARAFNSSLGCLLALRRVDRSQPTKCRDARASIELWNVGKCGPRDHLLTGVSQSSPSPYTPPLSTHLRYF